MALCASDGYIRQQMLTLRFLCKVMHVYENVATVLCNAEQRRFYVLASLYLSSPWDDDRITVGNLAHTHDGCARCGAVCQIVDLTLRILYRVTYMYMRIQQQPCLMLNNCICRCRLIHSCRAHGHDDIVTVVSLALCHDGFAQCAAVSQIVDADLKGFSQKHVYVYENIEQC